jgi:putative ABC transport system permease protein
MRLLVQVLVVARLGLSTLLLRKGSAMVIVLSMACVVGVLLSVLSVTAGLFRAYEIAGSPDRALVFSADAYPAQGGRAEEGSRVPQEAIGVLVGAPGLARGAEGNPLMAAESLALLPPADGFASGSLFVRGVAANSLAMRPEFRLTEGRLFRPGLHEMIVGAGAARMFGFKVGDRIIMPDGEWPIVGAFSAGGGIIESQLISDAETVMSTVKRTTAFNSVLVGLENAESFDTFRDWLTSNPAVSLTAERQSDYYRLAARRLSGFFTAVACLVGVIMALGALFGSVKILRAAVDSRSREIATLRAIGYDAVPVATSVVLEAIVLSLAGALIGAGGARILFDGRTEAIFNAVFALSVSPALVGLGVVWAVLIAAAGALAPAVRSARLPVAAALRQA